MLEEMDLPAILARAPELCLIDELAHTNVPGVEHRKRYEDVEDVLAAGIDVLSTVNVQHLESLNDQISELSGVRVRETIPDAVLGRADEIVMIDLTPEALLDRLRAGKVYPQERDRRRPEQLLPDREPRRAARGRAPPGGRGGRPQAPDHHRTGGVPRGDARRRRPPSGRRASPRPGRAVSRSPAAGAASVALGPAAGRRPRPAVGTPARPEPVRRAGALADRAPAARLGARRADADRGVR